MMEQQRAANQTPSTFCCVFSFYKIETILAFHLAAFFILRANWTFKITVVKCLRRHYDVVLSKG